MSLVIFQQLAALEVGLAPNTYSTVEVARGRRTSRLGYLKGVLIACLFATMVVQFVIRLSCDGTV